MFVNAYSSMDGHGALERGPVRENLKGLFNFFWPVAVMLFLTVFVLSLVASICSRRMALH